MRDFSTSFAIIYFPVFHIITAEELVDVGHDVSEDEVIFLRVEPAQLSDPTVQGNQALDRYNR